MSEENKKPREWKTPLNALIINNSPLAPSSEIVHVIEFSAYQKAVEALRGLMDEIRKEYGSDYYLVKTNRSFIKADKTLRELGEK